MADNPKLTAHYIKSPHFTELPLHGLYGGANLSGKFVMTVWSERMPIPQEMDLEIIPVEGREGVFSAVEGEKRGKDGMVRTVHAAFHFDLEMAKSMRDWLNDKIQAVESKADA